VVKPGLHERRHDPQQNMELVELLRSASGETRKPPQPQQSSQRTRLRLGSSPERSARHHDSFHAARTAMATRLDLVAPLESRGTGMRKSGVDLNPRTNWLPIAEQCGNLQRRVIAALTTSPCRALERV
jgi:hypothetical protein